MNEERNQYNTKRPHIEHVTDDKVRAALAYLEQYSINEANLLRSHMTLLYSLLNGQSKIVEQQRQIIDTQRATIAEFQAALGVWNNVGIVGKGEE